MKIYQSFYIVGVFLMLLSSAIYFLSTTLIINEEEQTVSNLLGKTTAIDTLYTPDEVFAEIAAAQRDENKFFLWIGIPLGVFLLLIGIIIKRKKEGPDLFLDDERDEEEESDLLF